MLFEIMDQGPLLNLITKGVQVVNDVISAVNPHSSDCNVHIRSLEGKPSHERTEHFDNGPAIREGFVSHLLQLVDDVLALLFETLDYFLNLDGLLLDVLVKLLVELFL